MLDSRARAVLTPTLAWAGGRLAASGVRPLALTGAGWLLGVVGCVAVAFGLWPLGLGLWLANRALDGLDGAVARVHGATDRGGFLDIVADFSIYAGYVLALAVALPAARLACVVLMVTYYVSGTAFLALSSLLERRTDRTGGALADERSLRFVGGVAEGTETVAVYVLLMLVPGHAELIIWLFAAAVAVTALQRVVIGARVLSLPPPSTSPATSPARHRPHGGGR